VLSITVVINLNFDMIQDIPLV